jgi:DNA sulfur modification protein DndB
MATNGTNQAFYHVFPALRGIQASREYYTTMCPLRLVPRLFQFNEEDVPPSVRAQRVLNTARIPGLANYITDNSESYVFSALTASIDGQVKFEAFGKTGAERNMGSLAVPMDARIIINDGQHRRAAIEEALKLRPDLGDEHIAVVFFLDHGLDRSQQMFADLNKHALRPSKSIGILFDHRDSLSRLACRVAETVDSFKNLIELEKTTISNRSIKLFTLSSLYQATCALLGKGGKDSLTKAEEKLVLGFWQELSSSMRDWDLAAKREITSAELRRDFVHAHGVALHAIGIAGRQLLAEEPKTWKPRIQSLVEIDWSRSNSKLWEGRALQNGKVSKSHQSLLLTSSYLKEVLGVSQSAEEKEAEARLASG